MALTNRNGLLQSLSKVPKNGSGRDRPILVCFEVRRSRMRVGRGQASPFTVLGRCPQCGSEERR
jgi:hypothetical protein